ncbi:glycosyl transferase family 2 [Chlorobaculum parvum NCIB 8327]|uniref:Glycosyl transferase family 2 n=1 Tax=Chlorobaculum parvum (strain DSM 263 / NCIMB 8327) TaxID=517417 RepID=B3QML3_CHLP8|nr:TIGR04283 family arsenosugar biosynthesis glycosyltransferase [Chlorobaculum parvum]ACF11166.1 glycosyl transferase family 2 [Chlorobaculum parvum NCIB 8327]
MDSETKLSIIIPAWNEEATIAKTLEMLLGLTAGRSDTEIIVSVSGDDRTAELASAFPVTVCHSEKGRAIQMNTGAKLAKGSILYFLHADTVPPPSFCNDILSAVERGFEAGCFRMTFDDPDWLMQLYGWFTQFPLTICRGGDQSLFITRELFERIGGFDERMQIMEDIDIIERIQRQTEFHILDSTVTTSARKYHANGTVRLQAIFGTIHLMYALGFSQDDIREFYRNSVS